MEQVMSRTGFFLTPEQMLDQAVSDVRNRGYTRAQAVEDRSTWFGIAKHKLHKLIYGDVVPLSDAEARLIHERYVAHLKEEADHYTRRLEAARTRLNQLELNV